MAEDSATPVQVIRPDLQLAPPYKNKVTVSVAAKPGAGAFSSVGEDGFYVADLS